MPDVALAQQPLTNRQIARREASKPGRVTGKLRQACDAMIYEGMQLDEAAHAIGFPIRRLRLALSRPHVLAYLRQEREVLRASMSGANILTLAEIRRNSRNDNARVNAVKALEQMGDDQTQRNSNAFRAPGMVIQIVNTSAVTAHLPQNTTKPLQTLTIGHTDAE